VCQAANLVVVNVLVDALAVVVEEGEADDEARHASHELEVRKRASGGNRPEQLAPDGPEKHEPGQRCGQ